MVGIFKIVEIISTRLSMLITEIFTKPGQYLCYLCVVNFCMMNLAAKTIDLLKGFNEYVI